MAYSFSRIDRYLTCPLSYKFEYVDKLPAEKADPLLIGGVCHDFFEAYDRHLINTKQESDYAGAEQIMIDVFARFERPLKAEIFDDFMAICQEHVKQHTLNLKTVVGVEEQIALDQALNPCGWDAPEAWIRCKLDRLDIEGDVATIVDYKTGWGGDADKFQLDLYALAVCRLYPFVQRIHVEMHYTRSGWHDRTTFARDRIVRTEKLLRAYVKQIEADKEFKALPGRGCPTCAYALQCPLKATNLLVIKTLKDATQIANDILILGIQYDKKKDALEKWCENSGPILTNGVAFGHNTREYYKVNNPDLFLELLKEAQVDANEFYKIDTTALKKKCSKDPVLAHKLANVIDVDIKSTFGQRQGPKPEKKLPAKKREKSKKNKERTQ